MTPPVDTTALVRILDGAFPGPLTVTRAESLSGGASAETCAVDVLDGNGSTHALILRRAAGGNAFNPGVGKREEALTQQAAGHAGVAVAQVFAIFDNDAALGSGYVMQRFAGETIPRKLLRDERFGAARARLVSDCGAALAGIHRVPVGSLPALPELPAEKQLLQLEAMHHAFGQPVPVFSLAIRWLRERLPPAESLTLVHGDFRTGNFLVDESGLVAVLDWELVHLGNPLEDLGWLCAPAWRFGGDGAAGGFASREQLFAAYESAGGAPVDPVQVRFWEVFATLRWGVICQFQAFAHLNGMATSVERATVGRRVTETELDLLLLMDGKL
jgi:aminoglycoside phosphotransferase (APT) family kinase protein